MVVNTGLIQACPELLYCLCNSTFEVYTTTSLHQQNMDWFILCSKRYVLAFQTKKPIITAYLYIFKIHKYVEMTVSEATKRCRYDSVQMGQGLLL